MIKLKGQTKLFDIRSEMILGETGGGEQYEEDEAIHAFASSRSDNGNFGERKASISSRCQNESSIYTAKRQEYLLSNGTDMG